MRNKLKKLLWPVLEKPWQSPVMEVRYGLWQGVSALYSQSGRQLGEENTRPFLFNHHLAAETIACKYQGSRSGRQINMSALRIAMRNFDEALAITGAVRHFHLARIGSAKPLGVWDLHIIARASIAILAYQRRCTHEIARNKTVGDPLASQYQFISGIFMICREMMHDADAAMKANHPVTASALYSYADAHGVFISFNGMACAGSTKKIIDFIEYCNTGTLQASETGDTAAPVFELGTLMTDPENWYRYALSTIELDCFIEIEALKRRAAEPEGASRLPDADGIYRAISDYCVDLSATDAIGPTADFTTGVLARQNHILQLLGRRRIDSISARHLADRLRY